MGTRAAQLRRIGASRHLARTERVSALLVVHERSLRGTVRRYAPSREDAEDAFQRTVEILLRKAPEIGQIALLRWATVVARREALALGRARARRRPAPTGPRGVPIAPDELPSARPGPAQLLESSERVAEAAAGLARLKPQERRALGLQAAGCSYAEIEAITGWTYTKVNRCMAEGRKALRESFARIEAGEGR